MVQNWASTYNISQENPDTRSIYNLFFLIKEENVALILGDNIFHSGQLTGLLNEMASLTKGSNTCISSKRPQKVWCCRVHKRW